MMTFSQTGRAIRTALAMLTVALPAGAANYNDAATGDWTAPATWGGGGYPASADDNVTLDSHAVTLDSSLTINALALNNRVATLNLGDNALTVEGGFIFPTGELTGNGELTVTNSNLTISTADPGPTNRATIHVYGGGYLFCNAGGRVLANHGRINIHAGRFTNNSLRVINGSGSFMIGTGAVFFVPSTGESATDFVMSCGFNNHGKVVSSNAVWSYGNGTNSGSFEGLGFRFPSGAAFMPGSSITASNILLGGAIALETGSTVSAYGLVDLRGQVRMESSNTGNVVQIGNILGTTLDGEGTLTSTGRVTIKCGVLSGPGALDARGGLTVQASIASITNSRTLAIRGGGYFSNSFNSARRFINKGRVELVDGEFEVNTTQVSLFMSNGVFVIGPSATVHRTGSAVAITHENPTTNAGAIKVSTGTVNFTGGLTQTETGCLRGDGGGFGGTLTIGGGRIAPGAADGAAGTLTLSGTANLSTAATVVIELGGAATNAYDRLMGGALNLNGAALDVSFIEGFQHAIEGTNTFRVLAGNVSGAFGNLIEGRLPTSGSAGSFAVAITTGVGGSVVLGDFQPGPPRGTVIVVR